MNRSIRSLAALPLCLALAASGSLLACGAPPPPVPPPTPEPVAEPTPEPVAAEEPPAEEPPPPAEPASTERPPSGRPPLFFMNAAKITEQVGETPSAKFELGGAEGASFRIPEYALRNGILVTFAIDKKAKRHKGAAGETYRLQAQIPPSADFSTVESSGPMFELRLPKTGTAANLAIGDAKVDDKGKESITWKVIAPKKVDDGAKAAFFELSGFTNAVLHLTTEAPGG